MDSQITIRPIGSSDRPWVEDVIIDRWGAPYVVVHDELIVPADLLGFIAEAETERIGLLTYRVQNQELEVVTLDSLRAGIGAGTALIDAVKATAQVTGSGRVWLITTNDNLDAIRFYQRHGFRLVRLDPGAVDRARRLKPIPLIGQFGLSIHDELELAWWPAE